MPDLKHPDHGPVDAPVHDDEAHAGEGGVDGDMLRAVMRRVASPVTVVTAAADGEARGATIGSFTSVSLDPPLVSFNVQRESSFYATISRADAFAIHLLTDGQAELANHFALPDLTSEAQFRNVPHVQLEPGLPPILRDTFGVLHCQRYAVHEAGDHALFIGRVERVIEAEGTGPLLYYARSYRAVGGEV
jgi:flavin reductase (DIM6/NTAB) family NADH-FMN oxidoreductase RutF